MCGRAIYQELCVYEKVINMTKVIWFNSDTFLHEDYQRLGIQFSLASPVRDGCVNMCHQWVLCRDFLADAVRAQVTGKKIELYGFCFDPEHNPAIDLSNTRVLVAMDKNPDQLKKYVHSGLRLIRYFERYIRVRKTTLEEVDPAKSGRSAVFLFTGSYVWIRSPFMLSLYTYLIRLGAHDIKFNSSAELKKALTGLAKTKLDSDTAFAKESEDLFKILRLRTRVVGRGSKVHPLYKKAVPIKRFHHNSG
ncbi:MAG: hypothetical protein DRI61_15060, partial [Chloroflexi bacterium]